MNNELYEQKGYLNHDYKFFHISDKKNIDIPYHYHDFHKLILVLGGKIKYMIEGREYELMPFDFVLVERYSIHKPMVEADKEPYDRIILYLSDEFLGKYKLMDAFSKTREVGSHVVRFPADISTELLDKLKKLENDLACEKTQYAGELLARIDVLDFLISFNKACIQENLGFKPEARYNRKVIDLLTYINDHISSDLSIDYLADHFYLSKYHMMRLFKNETGYSIHQYISEKRILLARNLIMSGTPATSACLECGFKDYSSFSRAFKNQLGVLPSEVVIS